MTPCSAAGERFCAASEIHSSSDVLIRNGLCKDGLRRRRITTGMNPEVCPVRNFVRPILAINPITSGIIRASEVLLVRVLNFVALSFDAGRRVTQRCHLLGYMMLACIVDLKCDCNDCI